MPLPDTAVTIPIPAATVTVDDPGAEPRTAVTIHPTEVQATSLFTNSLQVSQVTGDQPAGGNEDLTVPITAQPQCAHPGRVTLFFGAPTSTDRATVEALATTAGTVGELRSAGDGAATALLLAAPAGTKPAAQSIFEQALLQTLSRTVVLPAEPIGPGARWTVTRHLRGETALTQTMHVTLAQTTPPVLKVKIDESPDNNIFRIPGSNQKLTIDSFTSAGAAQVTLDPARALPVSGSLQLQGGRSLSGGEGSKTLVQRTGFTYRWG